jgi:TetR/AcrR family transcriptional repressor of nem operon
MGSSQDTKAETHDRIVRIASRRFRERGLDGIGVAEVMKEAGLTVGGFYKHFDSRDELVAEAVSAAFGRWQLQVEQGEAEGRPFTLTKLVDSYLSERHRDDPGAGCAIGALSGEIARSSQKTRAATTVEIQRALELIAGLVAGRTTKARRAQAIVAYSALVGAISLSRVVADEELSKEILSTVRKALVEKSG